MTMTTGRHGAISSYLGVLQGELRAPSRPRARILHEVADHLVEAAQRERERGADPEEAERRAIARFGAPHEVARQFAPVLAVSRARAVGQAQVVALAAVFGAMLLRDPFVPRVAWPPDRVAPTTLTLASVGATWAFVGAVALGLWTFWRSWRVCRDPRLPFGAARAIVATATLSLAALAASVGADTLASVQWATAGQGTQVLSIRLISAVIQCTTCSVGWHLVHRAGADIAALAMAGPPDDTTRA